MSAKMTLEERIFDAICCEMEERAMDGIDAHRSAQGTGVPHAPVSDPQP